MLPLVKIVKFPTHLQTAPSATQLLAQRSHKRRDEKLELVNGLTLGHETDPFEVTSFPQEVLLIWGKFDKMFPLEKGYELQKVIGKDVRLEIIDESSHVPQLEKPDIFNRLLREFIIENATELRDHP